jgi:hypothetical protein
MKRSKVPAEDMPAPDEYKMLVATIRGFVMQRPEFGRIKAPVLAYFTISNGNGVSTANSTGVQPKVEQEQIVTKLRTAVLEEIAQFQSALPKAKIIRLENTQHDFYLERGEETAREILELLAEQ